MRVIQSFWPSNETVKEPNNTTSLQLSSEVPPIILIFMAAVLCCVTPRLGGEDAIASECFDTWTWRSYISSILFSQPPAHLLQYTLCVLCWPLLDSLWPPYFQQRRCKPSPSCWLHLSVSFVGNRIHTVLQSVKGGGAYSSNLVVFTHLIVLILQFQLCNWVCWQGNKSSFSYSVTFALFCCFMFDVGGEGRLSKQNIFYEMHIYDITVWRAILELYLTEVKLQSPDVPLSHLDLLPKWEQNRTQNKYNYKDVCSYAEVIDVILFTFK